MHYVAPLRITSEDVGDDLAECFWIQSFVNVLDGGVDVFLGRGHAAHDIALRCHCVGFLYSGANLTFFS